MKLTISLNQIGNITYFKQQEYETETAINSGLAIAIENGSSMLNLRLKIRIKNFF